VGAIHRAASLELAWRTVCMAWRLAHRRMRWRARFAEPDEAGVRQLKSARDSAGTCEPVGEVEPGEPRRWEELVAARRRSLAAPPQGPAHHVSHPRLPASALHAASRSEGPEPA
jgi:hypothetical protein